jgi:hypothetical protein
MLEGVYPDDENEFFRHVYNPLTDPVFRAGSAMHDSLNFDLLDELIETLYRVGGQQSFGDYSEHDQPISRVEVLQRELIDDSELLDMLRLLVGKTETQISLDLSLLFWKTDSPIDDPSLCGCEMGNMTAHSYSYFKNYLNGRRRDTAEVNKSAEVVASYLEGVGVLDVLEDFSELSLSGRRDIITKAIVPHDGRQSRAKRQGHGAEAEIARVVEATGANSLPQNKIANPMAGDVEFEGQSYDLIVEDTNGNVRVCIIGLFHTSNPGQYGVSKTAETEGYLYDIESYNERVSGESDCELWSFCDGAGFAMNNTALRNVLDNVHDWIQIKSLWKLPLSLAERGMVDIQAVQFSDFYTDDEVQKLDNNIENVDVITSSSTPPRSNEIEAGEAKFFI